MILLTLLYSDKVLNMRIKRKFDINGDEQYDINDDNDNNNEIDNNDIIENKIEDSDKKNKKKLNTGAIKMIERNLKTNPPKKIFSQMKKNDNNKKSSKKKEETDKKGNTNIINTKKLNKNNFEEKISSSDYPSIDYDKSSVETMKDIEEESDLNLIKSEEKLLRVDYEVALRKNKAEVLIMIMTEILDKIYLFKSVWLLQKYELFSLQFSLYILWHMMMLSFFAYFMIATCSIRYGPKRAILI